MCVCVCVYLYIYIYISSSSTVICQMTGPKPLPKRFLHIMRSRASSFNWQYPLPSLRSSSSFLRLLPRLLVTSICPFIFPSITCCRRQFLRKMWPIQLAFRFLISCSLMYELKKKKIGKVLTSAVGIGPSSYEKKNLPGRGLTKAEKRWYKDRS